MLHIYAAHMLHTQYIHIACMRVHKNWFSAIRMPYKHMKKCMQFVCNCLHAACMLHIIIAHILHTFIQMCATSCACMWHACGAEPIFMYAAYIQYGCIVCAVRVQRICTVCAARKQIYVQHTSNLSVRVSMGTLTIQWYCACAQSRCIAIVHRELF